MNYFRHCGRVWLKSVRQKARFRCCFQGKANAEESSWPKLKPLPENLLKVILGEHGCIPIVDENGEIKTAHSPTNNINHFSRNSARYNGIFSISATGVENGKGGGWERISGQHAVKMCGRTYHFIPRSNTSGGIKHFILDKYTEALMHGKTLGSVTTTKGVDSTVKDSIVLVLWDCLHEHNRFVQHCKIIGEAVKIVNDQNYPDEDYEPASKSFTPEVIAQINSVSNIPHLLDIASVTDDSILGKRIIQFKLKGATNWNNIPTTHQHIEPLSYPILFLAGEDGWGLQLKDQNIHFPDYIVSRMLMPEEQLFVRNAANTKFIQANRFQLFARVAQYWLCDCVSRSIENRLEWIRNNQSYFTDTQPTLKQLQNGIDGNGGEADLPNDNELLNSDPIETINIDNEIDYTRFGEADPEEYQNQASQHSYENNENDLDCNSNNQLSPDQPGYRETGKTFLSSDFHGSRRHLRKLSQNGLIVVSEKGTPHLFITLTCNTEWAEIKDRLFYGQTAFDRPDVTTQVFKARLTAFLHNLRNGKYFRTKNEVRSQHTIEYEMMCIEYQNRGLPHAHLVLRLGNMPEDNDKEAHLNWI